MRIPRLVISGLSGGAGKTMFSLGLARAFARKKLSVRAFKKGPDYIDAAWLALAAGARQANLDPFFSPGGQMLRLFLEGAAGSDVALVEGNRGLFDGLDIHGSCSTAELSRALTAPVLLVLDCTKMTRTVAAVVTGCLTFEKNLHIGGVILNRTGTPRHRDMVRQAVEEFCPLPVLGVLPRLSAPFMLERHMGLAGVDEFAQADELLNSLADFVEEHADIDAILNLAGSAPEIPYAPPPQEISSTALPFPAPSGNHASTPRKSGSRSGPVIGYARDAAFWFYYHENLEALKEAGACLVPLSLLDDAPWPEIQGLYIGGGLPELYAAKLSANAGMRERVAALAQAGLPMYAECGGFLYLARSLEIKRQIFPMAGVFDVAVSMHERPQGLGYVEACAIGENPFHPCGVPFRGHEFHFSAIHAPQDTGSSELPTADRFLLALQRGRGMAEHPVSGCRLDGMLAGRAFAAYMHIYAPAVPHWASRFVSLCLT